MIYPEYNFVPAKILFIETEREVSLTAQFVLKTPSLVVIKHPVFKPSRSLI